MHLIANGDTASMVFFGSLTTLALLGPLSMDRKKLRLDPELYSKVLEQTSYLPFVAIMKGKNHLSWSEIGWKNPAIGLTVFIVVIIIHPWISGVKLI
jgi:uncharacterized membrane protein